MKNVLLICAILFAFGCESTITRPASEYAASQPATWTSFYPKFRAYNGPAHQAIQNIARDTAAAWDYCSRTMWSSDFLESIIREPNTLNVAIKSCKDAFTRLENDANSWVNTLIDMPQNGDYAKVFVMLSRLNHDMAKFIPDMEKCYQSSWNRRQTLACIEESGSSYYSEQIGHYLRRFSR